MPANLNQDDFGRVVRVEFDYTYKANDGRMIKIKEGDEYVLVKKSNDDWWQVVDKSQKKPLYVPSAYVKELSQKRFPDHPFIKRAHNALMKSMKSEDDGKLKKTVQRLSDGPSKERMIVVTGSREDLNVLSGFSHTSKFSELRASTDSLDKFIEDENPYDVVPFKPLAQPRKEPMTSPRAKARTHVKEQEDPDYENLDDFTSTSEQQREPDLHTSPIRPKRGSGGKNPPAVSKKPSFRHPDLQDKSDIPMYANLQGKSAIKPAIPSHHSPQSSTRVEILDEGWELQLDNQTGNKYYYQPNTGEMRAKPPRKNNESTKRSEKVDITDKTSPEPEPRSKNKSPPRTEVSSDKRTLMASPLQRRKTSPARFKDSKKAPFLQKKKKREKNDENISPNENNSNNFSSPASSPVASRDSSKKGNKWQAAVETMKEKKPSHSRASSGTSRSLSPDASIPSITYSPSEQAPPVPSGWIKERSSDGETILVNSVSGDRWIEFYDVNTGNFYYCDEQTRVTVWDLPPIDDLALNNNAKGGVEKNSVRKASAKHERTSSGPHNSPSATKGKQSSIRKSKTLDRDSFPPTKDSEFGGKGSKSSSLPWPKKKAPKSPPTPPSANLKPRKGRSQDKLSSKRMLHTQSMIILDDNIRLGMSPYKPDDDSQIEVTRDDSTERGSLFPPPPHPMIERQGRLNWTKLAEAGKKMKKSWTQQWVVLLGNNLLFYKDQKQAMVTKANPHGKPESSCELRGACIEWAKEKSSKKNVFEVSTVRGFCFLLQHDDTVSINEWFKSIEATIKRVNQVEPLDHSLFVRKDSRGSTEDEGMENNNHLDVKDKKKKEKDKRKDKDKKGKPPSRHGSDAKQSDRVRSKLRKFIGKRPTMESLQERGLIKETVFGCPLHKLCEKEGTNVPQFVKMCVEEVEKRGLDIDGIYRVSGNLSHVQKLRYMVDREIEVDLGDSEWEDIHVITGALKMFLRELPEPVIPFQFFDKFIATCRISDKNSKHDATKSLIRALPKPNKETLKYLLQHFCKVVNHSESNRMQVQNVAIVFGPTLLLKPPEVTNHHDPGGGNMAVFMMYQNQIIDYMLTEFKALF